MTPLRITLAALGAAALAGCGARETFSLIDAAALYRDNRAVFHSIRAAYPGPYADFFRVPARNPSERTAIDDDFFRHLSDRIPVEFVDFFPIGDTGADEMNVVLKRYASGHRWHTVKIVYFGMALKLAPEHEELRMFETCGAEAAAWIASAPAGGAAFCLIEPSWYAYQKVE